MVYELIHNFKRYHNINKIEGEFVDKYRKYELEFCESVVTAIEFGNTLVAHAKSGKAVKVKALDVFDSVVDEFMTIFYNAMVGSNIKKDV